jgi:hypothetical protein
LNALLDLIKGRRMFGNKEHGNLRLTNLFYVYRLHFVNRWPIFEYTM